MAGGHAEMEKDAELVAAVCALIGRMTPAEFLYYTGDTYSRITHEPFDFIEMVVLEDYLSECRPSPAVEAELAAMCQRGELKESNFLETWELPDSVNYAATNRQPI
jgi:hypothetical protein